MANWSLHEKEERAPVEELVEMVRSRRAQVAATHRVVKPEYDGAEATRPARKSYWAGLLKEVNPQGTHDAAEAERRAKRLFWLRMAEGKQRKLEQRLRRAKRSAKVA